LKANIHAVLHGILLKIAYPCVFQAAGTSVDPTKQNREIESSIEYRILDQNHAP